MSTTTTLPVNPLTGDLTTITVRNRNAPDGKADVQGRIVAPGLALTPAPRQNAKEPDRYALTHIATGLAVIPDTCGVHALQGAEQAVSVNVDWTTTEQKAMVAAIKAHDGFMALLSSMRFACSGRWCTEGDGPEPPSWSARCVTCGWEWDEDEGEAYGTWPLSQDEARSMADEHQCDPQIELRSPETGAWGEPWTFQDRTPVADIEAVTAR